MTPAQRDLTRAALGLRERNGRMPRWSSRNSYAVGLTVDTEWDEMEGAGWASRHRHFVTGNYLYRVTRAGAEAAGVLGRCRKEDVRR